MFHSTLQKLRCPARASRCGGTLVLLDGTNLVSPLTQDLLKGTIQCEKCRARFPILAGVALLVPDVEGFLIEHVKGISKWVHLEDLPAEHRPAFARARDEIEVEHIEEDLESERVNALYLMTHYLRADDFVTSGTQSPLLARLIRENWDHGPFARIRALFESGPLREKRSLVELGCGAGGLFRALRGSLQSYLGVDSSFASIAYARHLNLGAPLAGDLRIPQDLLHGTVSSAIEIPLTSPAAGTEIDFVVADVENPPLRPGAWSASAALNLIDMLYAPAALPRLQAELLEEDGIAIQSSPYIWHEQTAAALRQSLPPHATTDSATAIEALYKKAGFEIIESERQIPWLFYKNSRQLEIYSVHLLAARVRR